MNSLITNFKEFHISISYKCNFKCEHCCQHSSPEDILTINDSDKNNIVDAIRNAQFDKIFFSGGEPSLCLKEMDEFISIIKSSINSNSKIGIITNGWFVKNDQLLNQILEKVNILYVSIDKYHLKYITIPEIKKLCDECNTRGIEFQCISTVDTPEDLLNISDWEESLGYKIQFQVTLSVGRALDNNIVSNENRVFTQDTKFDLYHCPTYGKVLYDPRYGFNSCCCNLLYDKDLEEDRHQICCKNNIKDFIKLDFYNFINDDNFFDPAIVNELIELKYPIKTTPICTYCKYKFTNYFLARKNIRSV
ncbi:MAG: 4Fe-4S cluster-binding domain-containing protein [Oligoflexia bacterium]|nr:4Fe-4S cluster-binding domain-containing protein [Oligoflexia bacterium]